MAGWIRGKSSQLALLSVGVSIGLLLSRPGERILLAGGADRQGESAVITGTFSSEFSAHRGTMTSLDTVFYLDYRGSRILAFLPPSNLNGGGETLIETIAERDLAADFGVTPGSPPPHFLMSTGSFEKSNQEGRQLLFVFETVSKRVGLYRVTPQMFGARPAPKFELLQMKSFASVNSDPPLPR